MGDGNFKWYWGRGKEPDTYYKGEDTREATIQHATNDSDGDGFTIAYADKAVARYDIFDADRVIEDYEERNEECWNEDGPDILATPDQSRELESALAAVLKDWMTRHNLNGRVGSFGETREQEYFPPNRSGNSADDKTENT